MVFYKKHTPWNKGVKGYMGANETSFQKGLIPWNKGKKGYMGANKTSFQKGMIPISKVPVGTIKIRHFTRGNSDRQFIKIAEPKEWILLAVYNWEKKNGKTPKGYIIHHKDRNKLNDDIANLVLLSRAEHLNEHRKEYKKEKHG